MRASSVISSILADTRSSWKRTETDPASRARWRAGHQVAVAILDQRVAALQRALGVVRFERDPQRAPGPARGGPARPARRDRDRCARRSAGACSRRQCAAGRVRLAAQHQQAPVGHLELLGQSAAPGRADLAHLLVRPAALAAERGRRGARELRQPARAVQHGAAPAPLHRARPPAPTTRAPRRNGRAPRPRRRGWVSSTTPRPRRRSGCGRCGVPPTRSRAPASSATVRHSVSSENAIRSITEPPPRATTIVSTSPTAARSRSAVAIRGAARRSCTGANAHTSRPGPSAPAEAGEDVVARLSGLSGHHADRTRQRRAGAAAAGARTGPRRGAFAAAARSGPAARPRPPPSARSRGT